MLAARARQGEAGHLAQRLGDGQTSRLAQRAEVRLPPPVAHAEAAEGEGAARGECEADGLRERLECVRLKQRTAAKIEEIGQQDERRARATAVTLRRRRAAPDERRCAQHWTAALGEGGCLRTWETRVGEEWVSEGRMVWSCALAIAETRHGRSVAR